MYKSIVKTLPYLWFVSLDESSYHLQSFHCANQILLKWMGFLRQLWILKIQCFWSYVVDIKNKTPKSNLNLNTGTIPVYIENDYCKFPYLTDKSFNVKFHFFICSRVYLINRHVYLLAFLKTYLKLTLPLAR